MMPTADGSLVSRQLGLRLLPEGPMLRLLDLRNGQKILTRTEQCENLATELKRLKGQSDER